MIHHLMSWPLRADVDRASSVERIRTLLMGLDGKVDSIRTIAVVENIAYPDVNNDLAVIATFDDVPGLQSFVRTRCTRRQSLRFTPWWRDVPASTGRPPTELSWRRGRATALPPSALSLPARAVASPSRRGLAPAAPARSACPDAVSAEIAVVPRGRLPRGSPTTTPRPVRSSARSGVRCPGSGGLHACSMTSRNNRHGRMMRIVAGEATTIPGRGIRGSRLRLVARSGRSGRPSGNRNHGMYRENQTVVATS